MTSHSNHDYAKSRVDPKPRLFIGIGFLLIALCIKSQSLGSDLSSSDFRGTVESLEVDPTIKKQLIEKFEGAVIDSLVYGRLLQVRDFIGEFSQATSISVHLLEDRITKLDRRWWFDRPERWDARFKIDDEAFIQRFFADFLEGIIESDKKHFKFNGDGRLIRTWQQHNSRDFLIKLSYVSYQIEVSLLIGERHTVLSLKKGPVSRAHSFDSPLDVVALVERLLSVGPQ